MFNEKQRLHFAAAIVQVMKEIKSVFFPAILVLATNGFSLNVTSFESILQFLPLIILIIVCLATVGRGIIKWLTFTYWIEDNELKTAYGLLFKKKRFVPIERIQSLNYNEGIIHRLFGVVQVSIETAGGTAKDAEVELTAVTRNAASKIEQMLQAYRKQETIKHDELEQQSNNEATYKITNKQLLLLATTSNSIGIVLAGTFAVISQLSDYIPFEKISSQFGYLLENGFVAITLLIIMALLIAWLIAVVMTYFSYYDFQLSFEDEQLEITRGLLEKKKITIPFEKIQAIKIVENPLRQLFGYASVTIENAGTSMTSATEQKVILLPFIKKVEIEPIIERIVPNTSLDMKEAYYSPTLGRALFYRKYLWFGIPLTVLLSIYSSMYFLLLFILIAFLVALAYMQHRSAGFKLDEDQLYVQFRNISKVLFIVKRNKIQAMKFQQNIFQKRYGLYTVVLFVMGNIGGVKAKAYHQPLNIIEHLYYFIKKEDV